MTCRHCGRTIELLPSGDWIDPAATGDDAVWRFTCDAHDTFVAEHEPGGLSDDDRREIIGGMRVVALALALSLLTFIACVAFLTVHLTRG